MDKQENAKKVKVPVPGDKKRYCSGRYEPGRWNGLRGGSDYALYFDMEDINRVRKMEEVAFALEENGIGYNLTKLKRQYRILISENDYFSMDQSLRKRIFDINFHDRL